MSTTHHLVTVGVPVYRGAEFLEAALGCIQAQTHGNLEVIISLDGPDAVCEAICAPFLHDARFRLVVQPERLGWAGNISWLMSQAQGDYWYFQQQDDLVDQTYVETLLDHLVHNPEAVLAYCDIVNLGAYEGTVTAVPSTAGPPLVRALTLLLSPYLAVGFRGLTRTFVVRSIGGIPVNAYEGFACDMTWLMAVARAGELHRVPQSLYRKRYLREGMTLRWHRMSKRDAGAAWATHCFDMLQQALLIDDLSPQDEELLWLAAVQRLTAPDSAGRFLHLPDYTRDEVEEMRETFSACARQSWLPKLQAQSESEWKALEARIRRFFGLGLNDWKGDL